MDKRVNILSYKDINLNTESKVVKVGQTIIKLTAREFAILELLLTKKILNTCAYSSPYIW